MSQLQLSIYTAAYVAYFSVIAAGFSSKLPPLNNLIRHAWQPKHNLMMTSTPPATASENGTTGTTGGDAWEQVRAKQMADESFSAACIDVDHKRKGAIFLVDGLRAFLPKVHLSTSASGQCALSDDLIGRILPLKILEIDREKDKVVVSHCRAMGEADPNEMVIEDAQQPASSADGDDERQQPPSKRRLRKRAKKMEALRRRAVRIAKNGGPPETTFLGEHKWLGGAVDPDTGKIYGIPSHSHKVICITPSSSDRPAKIATIGLPAEYQRGKFKWLRGVVHEGCLYGIPAWSTKGVLKVKLDTREVSVLPLPRDISNYQPMDISHYQSDPNGDEGDAGVDRGRWMWHGGAIGWSSEGDGNVPAIYCPPSNAEYVLKVYLDGSDRVEEIGTALPDGQNKWYGGIPGADGCIYAPPYTATGWLRVDPKTDTVEVLGDFPPDQYGWHGGLLAKSTGVIYAFPAHSNEVLCIDTNIRRDKENRDDNTWRVSTIPIKRHPDDTDSPDLHYKWLGGSYGADGCIYGMPSDATTILRIDPIKNEAITFGRVSSDINKWQGGVLSSIDNCVYAVPADNSTVLRIDTDPNRPLSFDYVGSGFQDVGDKWQGGFVGRDGKIYAIPENINQVMVITPGVEPSVEMLTGEEAISH